MRFEIPTAVLLLIQAFWDVMPLFIKQSRTVDCLDPDNEGMTINSNDMAYCSGKLEYSTLSKFRYHNQITYMHRISEKYEFNESCLAGRNAVQSGRKVLKFDRTLLLSSTV
jgi:hypothetical protein